MMRRLMALDRLVTKAAMAAAKIVFVAMGTSVFLQIVCRYVFNVGLNWVDEVSRFLLVWMAFLGAGFAIDAIEGTRVGFICDALPPRPRKLLHYFFRILILAMLAVLLHTGIAFARYGAGTKTIAVWGMSLFLPHLAIPVGAAVMMFKWTVATLCELFPDPTSRKEGSA